MEELSLVFWLVSDRRNEWWVVYLPNFIYVCRGEDMTRLDCLLALFLYTYLLYKTNLPSPLPTPSV